MRAKILSTVIAIVLVFSLAEMVLAADFFCNSFADAPATVIPPTTTLIIDGWVIQNLGPYNAEIVDIDGDKKNELFIRNATVRIIPPMSLT